MKKLVLILFTSLTAIAQINSDYEKFVKIKKLAQAKTLASYELSTQEADMFVEALLQLDKLSSENIQNFNFINSSFVSQIKILAKLDTNSSQAKEIFENLSRNIDRFKAGDVYTVLAQENIKTNYFSFYKTVKEKFKNHVDFFSESLLKREISDNDLEIILKKDTSYRVGRNQRFNNVPKLFLLCRHSRNFPCLFILKDKFGNFVKNENKLWSLPALAQGRGPLYHTTNGHTPSGLHYIDSVMPQANNQYAFGTQRRLILNFFKRTTDNDVERDVLGNMVNLDWWKQASVARDVNRKYLRIHGTGKTANSNDVFYPHVSTSGCVSTLEGTYEGIKYLDQRVLLDKLMEASDLEINFKNEEKIKALFYVIELNDKAKAVTLDDIKHLAL